LAAARNFREHLAALESAGLLVRVDRPIDKDTEMHPLVRWQFRGGIPEPERRGFLFTDVRDARGRRYDMPVAVGALASSRRIYALALGCEQAADEGPDGSLTDWIADRWRRARSHPIAPVRVDGGPCQEVVEADVTCLPVPISTPGYDTSPYVTAGPYLTRDPETGVANFGNYRAQIKGPLRVGMNSSIEFGQGIYRHWLKARAAGRDHLDAAIVVGGPPALTYCGGQKLPYDADELAVAGGLMGEPLPVVRARTVDLLVPAEADVVIEGRISTRQLEPEGCFGESHGHINLREYNMFMDVTAVTRRRDAVWVSLLSQVTPSESSLLKKVGMEAGFRDHLRNALGCAKVRRVGLHEPLTNLRRLVVVQFEPGVSEAELWRALYGAANFQPAVGKFVVGVDADIDPDDGNAVWWALCYRANLPQDVQWMGGRGQAHGPRSEGTAAGTARESAMLINATLREPFPPVALPARPHMERARRIWEELGLPPLRPESPWHGYDLGGWSEAHQRDADRAVRGEYWATGEELARRRLPVDQVEPNTPTD
jgi:UbiD family decarboxylase